MTCKSHALLLHQYCLIIIILIIHECLNKSQRRGLNTTGKASNQQIKAAVGREQKKKTVQRGVAGNPHSVWFH